MPQPTRYLMAGCALLLALSGCKKAPPPAMELALLFNGKTWHSCPVRYVRLGSGRFFRITCVDQGKKKMSLLFDQNYDPKGTKKPRHEFEGVFMSVQGITPPRAVRSYLTRTNRTRCPGGVFTCSDSYGISAVGRKGATCDPLKAAGNKKLVKKVATIDYGGHWPTFGTYHIALRRPCGVLTVKLTKAPKGQTKYHGWGNNTGLLSIFR